MNRKMIQMLRKVTIEMTGVFALNFFGGSSQYQGGKGMVGINISYAHVFVIGIIFLIGFPISGSHFNPIVTVCTVLSGVETLFSASILITGQLLGSFLSGISLKYSQPESFVEAGLGYPTVGEGITLEQAFFFETIGTFFLIFAMFAVIRAGYSHFVITLVFIGALIFLTNSIAPLGQCAMNPAMTLGPALLSKEGLFIRGWWIYYTASFLGGILGMLFSMFMIDVDPSRRDDSDYGDEGLHQNSKDNLKKLDMEEQLSQMNSSWQSDTAVN